MVDAYKDSVDLRLQQQFNTAASGVWPFGPQIIFCKPAILGPRRPEGQEGPDPRRVMAKFMERIGATPVTMAFGEVSQARSGTIDCAVNGPSSANSAGWPESATHMYPLAAGGGAGLRHQHEPWKKRRPTSRAAARGHREAGPDDIWKYSRS